MSIPLGLYVHIPWCERKCPYCDFNSHVARNKVDEQEYIDALVADLEFDLAFFEAALENRKIDSIFIGGGTPSLFSEGSITRLIEAIRTRIKLSPEVEITLEANPGSSEASRFEGFMRAGVNRLSIGAQSFNDEHLARLGRVHTSAQATAAAKMAAAVGVNFNLDLMYALPDQSAEQALSDLYRAIELEPDHLSCYQLTIEPNTLFHSNPPPQPSDDESWSVHLSLKQALQTHGFQQYEVSAFSQAGKQCRHNLNYWRFGDYLGIGAGAHGKISTGCSDVVRYWKIKHPATYTQRCLEKSDASGARSPVAEENRPFEFMLNALRLTDGFPESLFAKRTFLPTSEVEPLLEKHADLGLIKRHDGHIRPTERGRAMVDTMLQDYLP